MLLVPRTFYRAHFLTYKLRERSSEVKKPQPISNTEVVSSFVKFITFNR